MKKSRDVSVYDFLEILQEEYICNEIRSKIYPRTVDKAHYQKVLEGKKDKIVDIAKRNRLDTIFSDQSLYDKYWDRIVPEFGFPKFIYNETKPTSKNSFPYKGTIVEVDREKYPTTFPHKYGISEKVLFNEETVLVREREDHSAIHRCHYKSVRRLTVEELDKMFYYYPYTEFKFIHQGKTKVGILTSFDFINNVAYIRADDETSYPNVASKISRIL